MTGSHAALILLIGTALLTGCRRDDPAPADPTPPDAEPTLGMSILSTRPDMVTGGDALVRLDINAIAAADLRVTLNGADISTDFLEAAAATTEPTSAHSLQVLVAGLNEGPNTLLATAGALSTELTLVNHPLTGPVFSGPQIQPFVCSTVEEGLGEPLDELCTAVSQVG